MTPSAKADDVIPIVIRWVDRFGLPEEILSDQGSAFNATHFRALMIGLQTTQIFAPSFHQQSNGMVERFMATLKNMLAKFVSTLPTTDDLRLYIWTYLPAVTMAYNSSIHPALGDTPFYVMHGFDPRTLPDLFLLRQGERTVSHQLDLYRQHWQDAITTARRAIVWDTIPNMASSHLPSFELGQLVWHYMPKHKDRTSPTQFAAHWKGPYRIVKIQKSHSTAEPPYTIVHIYKKTMSFERVHPARLKRFRVPETRDPVSELGGVGSSRAERKGNYLV